MCVSVRVTVGGGGGSKGDRECVPGSHEVTN